MGMANNQIRREVIYACKTMQHAGFIFQEDLEIIATEVFLRVRQSNDGDGDTTLISGIRTELFDYLKSLGIRILPIRDPVSQRLDGPVDAYSIGQDALAQ